MQFEVTHLLEALLCLRPILYLQLQMSVFPQEWQRSAASSASNIHHQGAFTFVCPGIHLQKSEMSICPAGMQLGRASWRKVAYEIYTAPC